ncbi:hypothetical protein RND71_028951 [Anisodus tanguticus]|uniref:Uncharacterized protein n=1 Tax=Anisodus tanguticus TaxID=243964 RepID=A0AAE1RM90_9SOLA|nr:hypothetical protein RND71_028951 [Anisodus tanguticus]
MVPLSMLQILVKIARVYALRLPMQIVVVGDEHGYCGSRKFGITWLFYGDRDPL